MTVRGGWENQFVFQIDTTSMSANDDAATGLYVVGNDEAVTFKSGNNGFLVDDDASIMSGAEHPKIDKTTGLSQPRTGTGFEYATPKKLPTFSVGACAMNSYHMALFVWSLLQKGCSEAGGTPWMKTCIPYVSEGGADPEMWLSMSRVIGDGSAAIGHSLTGGIIHTLGITMTQGERVTISLDGYGRTFVTNYDHSSTIVGSTGLADVMFWDFSWTLAGTPLTVLESFEVSVNNNAAPKHYQSQTPSSYVLGKLDVTGSIKLGMSNATVGENTQIDNFISGTDVVIVGTASTPGPIVISTNARYNGDPNIDPAEEMMIDASFEGAYDGTYHSIDFQITDTLQRTIP